VSVTLLAAFIRLPQTAPPTEPGLLTDLSSLAEIVLLLNREADRWCERMPFGGFSGVAGREGGLMGVAGVMDMAGTSREVSRDKAGFG
jgi:hypothetical protein